MNSLHPQQLLTAHFNPNTIINTIKRKYPAAFQNFNSFEFNNAEMPQCFVEFINSFKLKISYKLTDAQNPNYQGTYSYKIKLGRANSNLLGRRSSTLSYYGLNSQLSAFEKSIIKAFHIIDCLLTGKNLSENTRIND